MGKDAFGFDLQRGDVVAVAVHYGFRYFVVDRFSPGYIGGYSWEPRTDKDSGEIIMIANLYEFKESKAVKVHQWSADMYEMRKYLGYGE